MSFGIKLNKCISSIVLVFTLSLTLAFSAESFGSDSAAEAEYDFSRWSASEFLNQFNGQPLSELHDSFGEYPDTFVRKPESQADQELSPDPELLSDQKHSAEEKKGKKRKSNPNPTPNPVSERDARRLERNRVSAKLSRLRKKQAIANLEQTVEELEKRLKERTVDLGKRVVELQEMQKMADTLLDTNNKLRQANASFKSGDSKAFHVLVEKIFTHFEKFPAEMGEFWRSYGIDSIRDELFPSGMIPIEFQNRILQYASETAPEAAAEPVSETISEPASEPVSKPKPVSERRRSGRNVKRVRLSVSDK